MVVSEIDVNLEGIEEAVAKLEQLNQKANEIRVSVSRITGEIKELNKQDISPSSGKEFELQLATRGALNRERESYRSELSKITGRESRIRAQLREAYKIAEHYGIDELTSAIPYEKIQKRTGGNRRSPIDVGNELTKTILNTQDIKSEEIKKEDVTETTSITDSIINTENNITNTEDKKTSEDKRTTSDETTTKIVEDQKTKSITEKIVEKPSADQQKPKSDTDESLTAKTVVKPSVDQDVPKSKGRKKRAAKSSGGGDEISDDPDEPKPEKKKRSLTDRITSRGREPKSKEHASESAPDAKEDKGLIYRLFGLFPKKQDTELQGDFNKSLEDTAKDQENVGRKTRDSTKKQRENNRSLKWTLGLLVMLHNVFRKFTSGTKVISQVLSMFSSGLGFLLDMIILPLLPFLIEMVMTIYGIGKAVKSFNDDLTEINPVLGQLASIFELIVFIGFGAILLNMARKIALLSLGAEAATTSLGMGGLLGALKALTWLDLGLIGFTIIGTILLVDYLGDHYDSISQIVESQIKEPFELLFKVNFEELAKQIMDTLFLFTNANPIAIPVNLVQAATGQETNVVKSRNLFADITGFFGDQIMRDTTESDLMTEFMKGIKSYDEYKTALNEYHNSPEYVAKLSEELSQQGTPQILQQQSTTTNTTTTSTTYEINVTGDNYFEDESDLKNFFENILSRQQ